MKTEHLIRTAVVTFVVLMTMTVAIAQSDFTQFFYEDGTVSSEGFMSNGKPDGYWKTYYPGSILKTEGNRKKYQLDSTWKFYRADGSLERIITYSEDIKSGLEQVFELKGTVSEEYTNENNIRQGQARYFYDSSEVWKIVQFVNNKEEGKGLELAKDGRIITMMTYRNGFLYASERINRFDAQGQRTGLWKDLYPNGQTKEEGMWSVDKRNGVFKFFDRRGLLERIEKYVDGELVTGDDSSSVLDVRREYDEEGRVRVVGSYREGKKQGTFRNYDDNGVEEGASIYEKDELVGEGLLDSIGRRQGDWKLYYPEGGVRSEGTYVDGLKEGPWMFYFKTGKVEQKGAYKADLPVGNWNWYYANGAIHRDETYRRGKEDGHAVEYDSTGFVINEGDYIDGQKTGLWNLTINDHSEKGEYEDGERNGEWVWFYASGKKAFEGEFQLGIPIGKHRFWYDSGQLKMKGDHQGGELYGPWQYFDESGLLIVESEYQGGVVVRINGKKIKTGKNQEAP